MSNLKALKNKIDSVTSTRKITQAMKMVAASKLRRAQERAELARPYSEKIAKIIRQLFYLKSLYSFLILVIYRYNSREKVFILDFNL